MPQSRVRRDWCVATAVTVHLGQLTAAWLPRKGLRRPIECRLGIVSHLGENKDSFVVDFGHCAPHCSSRSAHLSVTCSSSTTTDSPAAAAPAKLPLAAPLLSSPLLGPEEAGLPASAAEEAL
mmetsp:Transcript_4077/g.15218  ORF Transcript_4077/g.15218 Transcript_4077/m.15218 type:complete len:122 (+) Transcript_4077:37-402(+)